MSQASDFLRKAFGEGDAARDAGLSTPEGIERFDDVIYGTEADWQVLDVYRPKAAAGERLPVIVSVHGGGWVYGDKEAYQHYCMSLAGQGFAVVNFTYRLAPEFLYPANLEDTNLAVQWVLANAEAFLLDTNTSSRSGTPPARRSWPPTRRSVRIRITRRASLSRCRRAFPSQRSP